MSNGFHATCAVSGARGFFYARRRHPEYDIYLSGVKYIHYAAKVYTLRGLMYILYDRNIYTLRDYHIYDNPVRRSWAKKGPTLL